MSIDGIQLWKYRQTFGRTTSERTEEVIKNSKNYQKIFKNVQIQMEKAWGVSEFWTSLNLSMYQIEKD